MGRNAIGANELCTMLQITHAPDDDTADGEPLPQSVLEALSQLFGADLVHSMRLDVVSPEGRFTWNAGGYQVRSDGLHLTPSGVQDWIAPWLLPQLVSAVSEGTPHPT